MTRTLHKSALVFARFFLGERLVSVGMRTAIGLLFLTSLRGFFVASTSLTRRIRSGILDISIGVGSEVITEQLYQIIALSQQHISEHGSAHLMKGDKRRD